MSTATRGGVVAGFVGGAVLAIFVMFLRALAQRDIWQGIKAAAIPFLGDRARAPGLDLGAVLVGLLAHFGVSVLWGLFFGVLFFGLSRSLTILAGVVWGVVAWLVMFYAVLPVVGAADVARTTPVGLALFEHLLFGVSLAIGFLPFQRPIPSRVPVTP